MTIKIINYYSNTLCIYNFFFSFYIVVGDGNSDAHFYQVVSIHSYLNLRSAICIFNFRINYRVYYLVLIILPPDDKGLIWPNQRASSLLLGVNRFFLSGPFPLQFLLSNWLFVRGMMFSLQLVAPFFELQCHTVKEIKSSNLFHPEKFPQRCFFFYLYILFAERHRYLNLVDIFIL